jgi:hypothetical protein
MLQDVGVGECHCKAMHKEVSRWLAVQLPPGDNAPASGNDMARWNRTGKSVFAIGMVTVIYFGLAEWSKRSYVERRPDGKVVIRLFRPYEKFGETPFGVIAREPARGSLNDLADSVDNLERSPAVIYEDAYPLPGPGHSKHEDVAHIGHGRYSHWRGQGYVFSASDGSDPNTNGRSYWVVLPY